MHGSSDWLVSGQILHNSVCVAALFRAANALAVRSSRTCSPDRDIRGWSHDALRAQAHKFTASLLDNGFACTAAALR